MAKSRSIRYAGQDACLLLVENKVSSRNIILKKSCIFMQGFVTFGKLARDT
jgi:hypothetical protein